MNPISESHVRLVEAFGDLKSNWNSTKDVWEDGVSQNFEKEFMVEIETTTAASIDKLQKLMDTVVQADREMP
jgi:hypothetical protein